MNPILGAWTIRTVTEDVPCEFEPGTEVTFSEGADESVIVVVKVGDKEEEYVGRYDDSRTRVIVNPPKEQQHWEFVASEMLGDPPRYRMYGFNWAERKEPRSQPDPMGAWTADPQGY